MCQSYLSVLSLFLFSCKKCLFFQWGGGGRGGCRHTSGTYFFICSYFSLKMPYYPSVFTLKCHLLVIIQNFFPRSLSFDKLTNDFFSGSILQNINFLVLTRKGSLFSLFLFCYFDLECQYFDLSLLLKKKIPLYLLT